MLDVGCGEQRKRPILACHPTEDYDRTCCQNEAARQRQPAAWSTVSEIPALNIGVTGNLVLGQQRERGFIRRRDKGRMMPAFAQSNPQSVRSVSVLIDFEPGVFVFEDGSSRLRSRNGLAGTLDCEENE